ncbi:GNAT family N-acetyltransferase [Streptomyces sp. NPDC056304]|uniref:GNAT family N-acetyltransferase n=1 Tax=Streptomyces sp. NPDC056304 TaxID=3345778 RepID=UPI0035E02BD4
MTYPDDPFPSLPAGREALFAAAAEYDRYRPGVPAAAAELSGGQRHTEPVDVHLILRRETAAGPEVLLSRRAGQVYAAGLWHLPSGHLDGPHEDVVTALVREAVEETGVVIDPADVRAAVTVHHRSPGGASRTGHFFEVRRWQGEPRIAEPVVCDAMEWAPLEALPAGMVAYCRAGLDAYTAGARMATHFQMSGDAVVFGPGADRLRLVPDVTGGPDPACPDAAVVEFAERAVGRIRGWTDTSWAREHSRVWRAHGAQGGTWYVKVHQNERFHGREVRGLRTWAPALGAAAPRLVAADETLWAVVITAVPGRPLHGVGLAAERERVVFERIGALARRIHQSCAARPAPAGSGPAIAKADRHLAAARAHLQPGDEQFVRDLVARAERLEPLEWVETHGDFQLRNILYASDLSSLTDEAEDPDPFVAVIDLERSEPGPAVRDLVRLSDAWHGRPDLYEAFLAGYGRHLTPAEEARLVIDAALDSVSGIAYGSAHGDPELVERGRRTLARLRRASCIPLIDRRGPVNPDTAPAATTEPREAAERPPVRAAASADADGIIRMRSEHVLSTPLREEWIRRCTDELAPRLTPAGDARAFVIDAPDGTMAACALGLIHPVLPAPAYPRGLAARVHVVATHPDFRRRGYARAVVTALLDHLADAEDVTLFELHASVEARPLYRELGFTGSPALMRMTRLAPTHAAGTLESSPPWPPPQQYAEKVLKTTAYACFYFIDEDGRPLQLHSVYSPAHPWQLVGGTMDNGERPWETALRECQEETGLTVSGPPRLLATVYGLPGAEWPYSTIGMIFDGGRLTAAQIRGISLNPQEHDEVRALSLAEWRALMPARDFARLSAVEEARRTGEAAYFGTWDWGNE